MLCVRGELLWYLQLCTLPAIFTSPHQCWRDYVRLAICSYHCKKLKCDLHPLNSKNNGPILLLKTICTFGHRRCFLSYVATDGKDSKSICFKNHQKIMMVSDPWLKLFYLRHNSARGAFCVWVKALMQHYLSTCFHLRWLETTPSHLYHRQYATFRFSSLKVIVWLLLGNRGGIFLFVATAKMKTSILHVCMSSLVQKVRLWDLTALWRRKFSWKIIRS